MLTVKGRIAIAIRPFVCLAGNGFRQFVFVMRVAAGTNWMLFPILPSGIISQS